MNLQTIPVSDEILTGDRAQAFRGEKYYPIMFITPIDLKKGDRCTVVVEDGELQGIERDGKIIWTK
jgi:hypothetical protein